MDSTAHIDQYLAYQTYEDNIRASSDLDRYIGPVGSRYRQPTF